VAALQELTRRLGDRASESLERSRFLDRTGKLLTNAFARVVRPGGLKDLLSGTWLGHPVHPILTDVPIGVWTAAMAFDVVGGKRSRRASDSLIGLGIVAAVPTAVTGLSELADTSDRKERSLAAAHAIGNVTAVLLYSFSYLARKRGRRGAGILYSTTGWGTLLASGFLGGHLAFRKGVGVDRTRFDHRVTDWTSAIRDEDLPEAKPTKVSVGRTDVLLYREDGRIHAVAARCSHRGGPLHKGRVQDLHVTCPWHLSTFDLRDGSIVRGPATAPQPAYEVRVKDGTIEVRTPPD
jgi:nitrite reductase/ring-hydroxylating ferredoxin subunit/uncharacterized membrane protein